MPFLEKACKPNEKLARLEAELSVRVLLEPRAGVLLESFPNVALDTLLSAVTAWSKKASIKWVRVAAISEPDDPDWEEVVFKIAISSESTTAITLWQSLTEDIEAGKRALDERSHALLDRSFRVHVLWGSASEDSWRTECALIRRRSCSSPNL